MPLISEVIKELINNTTSDQLDFTDVSRLYTDSVVIASNIDSGRSVDHLVKLGIKTKTWCWVLQGIIKRWTVREEEIKLLTPQVETILQVIKRLTETFKPSTLVLSVNISKPDAPGLIGTTTSASVSGSSMNEDQVMREESSEMSSSNNNNNNDNNLNNSNESVIGDENKVLRKKRPPTPPKKPKINRSALPGYPFQTGFNSHPTGSTSSSSSTSSSRNPLSFSSGVELRSEPVRSRGYQLQHQSRSTDSYGSINKPSMIESMSEMRISTSEKSYDPPSDNISVRSFPFSSRDSLNRVGRSSQNQSPTSTYSRGRDFFGSNNSNISNSTSGNNFISANSGNNSEYNQCIISKPGQIVHISDKTSKESREENLSSLGTSHGSLERHDSESASDSGAKSEVFSGVCSREGKNQMVTRDIISVEYNNHRTDNTDDVVGEIEDDEPEEEEEGEDDDDEVDENNIEKVSKSQTILFGPNLGYDEELYDEPPKSDGKSEDNLDEEDLGDEPEEEEDYEKEEERVIETEDEEEAIYDTVAPDEASVDDNYSNDYDYEVESTTHSDYHLDRDSSMTNLNNLKSYGEAHSFSNYVNIDYFLRREETSSKNDSDDNETQMSRSMSSDHDIDIDDSLPNVPAVGVGISSLSSIGGSVGALNVERSSTLRSSQTTYDEVFEPTGDSEAENYYGISDTEHNNTLDSQESEAGLQDSLDYDEEEAKAESERSSMYKCILFSIVDSETVYVDCLNTLLQYKKALKSTTESAHPLVSSTDLEAIFHKINDLYTIHSNFLDGVKKLVAQLKLHQQSLQSQQSSQSMSSNLPTLGDLFKILASRLGAYSAYLKNYSKALETVQRCIAANNQFAEITRAIKLSSMKGQSTTLEELLHKPVARVQKNALILHDLLKYTPENSQEYKSLKTALKMTQCFLNELNIAATEQMFPVQDKAQRRLVKESFIIEAPEGRRKLRHLFLFNDTIVCAKYKPSTRQKFTFDVKWYALLCDITLPDTEDITTIGIKEKELSSEIRNLRSKVSSIRDAIIKEKSKNNSKLLEKLKKKQADHEGQLVLILPQLPFVITHKSGKNYTFYLSSEFERTQWIESIRVLQQSAGSSHDTVNFSELQAWIETCRKGLNPSLGSFLMRSSKDEDLLHGDLYLTIGILYGIPQATELFIVVELDNYGHFFQKANTKVIRGSHELHFNQDFTLDLDGSSTLRCILYEEVPSQTKPLLRGKVTLELGRSWLKDKYTTKELIFSDCKLSINLKFISSEVSTMRFPAGKVYGAFGVPISQVTKKEKSSIPYLIVGCVKEVERRGVKEVGIYRVSGLSSDIQRLKRAFESNPYEAEHLLKEIDINAITGLLKMYLRELPEALFTNSLYKKFFDAFSLTSNEERRKRLTDLFTQLPPVNQNTINFLIDHFVNVNKYENLNKMSLHNLATVFGPTLIRPGSSTAAINNADTFTAGTIDVMAQAGILYFFLKKRVTEYDTGTL